MEVPKKKKVRVAARLQRSRLNKSKGSMNVSFNTSRIRQTLKANNKQLARALAESRAMINTLQKQNLELQSNNQKLVTEFNKLKHVSGLSEKEIESEVEARFQERMNWLSDILNKMSTQFVSLVETFTELNYTSKFKTRPSSGPSSEQQPPTKPSQPIRSSNILEKVMRASTESNAEKKWEEREKSPQKELPDPEVQLSPDEFQREPCSSNPDLSVIMEQTILFENSILAASDVEDRSSREKYSRGCRRTAMTDFSTLKEFQDEDPENEEEMEMPPENQCIVPQSQDIPNTTAESNAEELPAVKQCGIMAEVVSGESEVQAEVPVKMSDTTTKSSRTSVRNSRKVRDTGQGSPAEKSLPSELDDTWTRAIESDAGYVESQESDDSKSKMTERASTENKGTSSTNMEKDKKTKTSTRNRRGTFEVKDPLQNVQNGSPQNGRVLRRETFAMPKAPNDKTSASPEKSQVLPEKQSQKKDDRRGTFVVQSKGKDQPEPTKAGGRIRRGTFCIEEPVEDIGILQQDSDVLITDDVLDDIESLDCEPQPRRSPPRSSIATSDGDITVNEVLDMELTTAINATILNSVEMSLSDPKKNVVTKKSATELSKPTTTKTKTSSARSKSKETISNKTKETDTSSADNEKGKNVFKAWLSKPGNITFTSGRKDLTSLAKDGNQKSRSKQKSLLPKKPRSKTGRSKPRLMPDMSPKTVFDFSGTPRNTVAETSKSVYDMSLNESVTATKQTYQDFKEKPNATISRPTLKMVKERFAKEPIEEATISPHGIMLVLGDGKRTKPRSKKQVSYSGKLTETHLRTPTAASPACIEDASKTPPGRSSTRASRPSISDESNASDAPDEVPLYEMSETVLVGDDNDTLPAEVEMVDAQPAPQETSVVYEENVKIMPDVAATPTPLKRLKGRKFTSTEEEMKALFESSLMTTPVVHDKVQLQRPSQQREKTDIVSVSERQTASTAGIVGDIEKLPSENVQKELSKDGTGKGKKSLQRDNDVGETSIEKPQTVKRRGPSKSPARTKRSIVERSPAKPESPEAASPAVDEIDIPEENLSPIQNKPAKKKQIVKKKSRSKATGGSVSPRKSNQSDLGTPSCSETDDVATQSSKNRKRGSSQAVDDNKEKLKTVSPKPKRSQKFDDEGFVVPVGSPPKRPRRGAAVSYKEPSLNCKMRKGEKEGTIFINNMEVKTLVGTEKDGKDGTERKKSTDKRTALKEIASD